MLVLLIYLSPNIFIPEQANYLVHDNLNSNVVWYKNLGESGKFFASNNEIIPNTLSGLPRGCYPSEFNFLHLFYLLFSPLLAYNLNIVIMHLVAFYGMFLLSRKYFFKDQDPGFSYFLSLIFSLLPFWPSGGLAIAGQPLLLYAFLNIYYNESNWKDWFVIILIPLYSVLVFANFFLMIILGFIFFGIIILKKKLNLRLLSAFLLFAIVSVIAEHKLFEMQFIEHFETHRDLKDKSANLNFFGLIGISLKHLFKGQYHFYSVNAPIVLFVSAWAFFVTKIKKEKIYILLTLFLAYIISLMLVLPEWRVFAQVAGKMAFLKGITPRFYSVFPILWICLLGYCSAIILRNTQRNRKLILMGIFSVLLLINMSSFKMKDFQDCKFVENAFLKTYFTNSEKESLSFSGYYREDIFKSIKEKVAPGTYRVASLGIEAEILQFNGYNTIDGYFYYYPKEYNEWFTLICRKEMQKLNIPSIGSHCEIVSADYRQGKKVIDSLELDFDEMINKNTKYFFSGVKINSERLKLVDKFGAENNEIFVYQIV